MTNILSAWITQSNVIWCSYIILFSHTVIISGLVTVSLESWIQGVSLDIVPRVSIITGLEIWLKLQVETQIVVSDYCVTLPGAGWQDLRVRVAARSPVPGWTALSRALPCSTLSHTPLLWWWRDDGVEDSVWVSVSTHDQLRPLLQHQHLQHLQDLPRIEVKTQESQLPGGGTSLESNFTISNTLMSSLESNFTISIIIVKWKTWIILVWCFAVFTSKYK